MAALCAVLQVADARLFKGSIKTKNDWQYVAKFCFNGKVGGTKGTVAWNIPSPSNPHRQLLMYWDQPDKGKQGSWTNVYKNKGLTCAQKSSVNDTAAGGIVNLHDVPSGVKHPGNSYNHYWWLVVADCGAASQTIPSYSIQFTQENGSQMSCDEEGSYRSPTEALQNFQLGPKKIFFQLFCLLKNSNFRIFTFSFFICQKIPQTPPKTRD